MARRTTKKKGSGGGFVLTLILVLLAIAVAGGIYYAASRGGEKDVLDKGLTGGAATVDLREESKAAQRAVDDILLSKDNWQLKDNGREDQHERMKETGGEVAWNKRQLAIGVPPSTGLEGAASWLGEKIAGAKMVVVNQREATYNGWDSVRMEIAIVAKAGDGKMNFVTDTVYFYHNLNLTKEDKDIKEEKEKKKEEKKPAQKYHGKLAVIIDDCGYDLAPVRKLVNLNAPFSYAILPYKDFSSDALHVIKSGGQTAMLHLPMEPMDRSAMSEGKNTVLTDMTAEQVQNLTRKAVDSLPGIEGVNNHQGSKATSNEATMKAVLKVLKEKKLFFVDSSTYSKSIGDQTARSMGIPTARNNIFLDNSSDENDIIAKIWQAVEMADRNGSAIAICHARPNTADAWSKVIGEVQASGIQLVPVGNLLK
ncbi:divergent polysaccharide deacetylase family protein [uncultured Phascolarctobacterium sp.]|uniref:divergent polysaccharide deacetylase family protein n=1 Tax=uncultured Phascolarctobacterium sp. TaxID=512296 RepID=UPI0015B33E78|nr:divergent polysaccharide deacetylase family protein [uncultured Phascolarctobacterium sp.]